MKPAIPEFSRPLAVDRVPKGGSTEILTADAGERDALARRLSLPAIHRLAAELNAEPWRGGGLKISGKLTAELEQVSVVSLAAFRCKLEFPVLRYFLPAGAATGEEDADVIDKGNVDLGEIIAETLALELDPYPRMEGEAFSATEADDAGAKPDSPFAVLSKLKRK